jgi:hypothetical protein
MSTVLGWILGWINPLPLIRKTKGHFKTRKFKRVFGKDACRNLYVIYNVYKAPSLGARFPKPGSRVRRSRSSGGTNLTTVNSCATSRAIAHLVYGITNGGLVVPKIASDLECDEKMDLSFLSIGGITNFKTIDLLDNDSNKFLDFRDKAIVSRSSGKKIIIAGSEPDFDHGFIVKIYPDNNKNRTWICCSGFAEWATSGAAWYLAHKWKEIHKWAKKSEFALIIKTRKGSDDSTSLLHRYLSAEEVESHANGLNSKRKTTQYITQEDTSTTITVTTTTHSCGEKTPTYTAEPSENNLDET